MTHCRTTRVAFQIPLQLSRAPRLGRLSCGCRAGGDGLTGVTRRDWIGTVAGVVLAAPLLESVTPPANAALPAEVGTYLPIAQDPEFALFIPDARKTPALRAGTVDPAKPYQFELPISFRESKVANILSGNYCQVEPDPVSTDLRGAVRQPRCDEPWTEVIFEDAELGRVALLASPLKKLTNRTDVGIEDIGTPEGIIESIGSYVTGTFLDEESVLSMDQKRQEDGRSYYYYEVDSPYGTLGRHSFTACTAKGEVALLLVASASDRQWSKSKSQLRHVMESFRA